MSCRPLCSCTRLRNNTTGSYTLTFKTSSVGASTITLPQGQTIIAICDGTNVFNAQTATTSSFATLTLGNGSRNAALAELHRRHINWRVFGGQRPIGLCSQRSKWHDPDRQVACWFPWVSPAERSNDSQGRRTSDSNSGIQRDGTQFNAPTYVDGQWVRFQYGLPRKMGGYKGIFLNASGISRGMLMSASNGLNYLVSGYSGGLEQWVTDTDDGVGTGPAEFTLTGFSANANNLWQMDIGYDSTGGGNNMLIAHPGLNLEEISNTVNTRPLFGAFTGTTLAPVGVFTASATIAITSNQMIFPATNLGVGPGVSVSGTGIPTGTTVVSAIVTGGVYTATLSNAATATGTYTFTFDNNISVSGGVVMLYPYLFVYGNNGLIQNCAAGDFNNWTQGDANANNVSSTKVVKGLPLRGGTTSPAGLFGHWTQWCA